MKRFAAGLLALASLWVGLQPDAVHAEVAVPPLAARVIDFTGTLNSQQRGALDEKLEKLERAKGSQIAVLMLPSTQPETIEQYGIRVGEKWKLGRKGVDDGAILIVAKQDRAMRIEVGYGLEGALSDAVSKRIISETITPYFKRGDFYEGINAGITAMIAVVNGEPLPEPKSRFQSQDSAGDVVYMLLGLWFMATFVVGPLLRAMLGRPLGAGAGGLLGGWIAYAITGFLAAGILVGVITLLATLFGGMSTRRWTSRGGWTGGGWGGGFGGWGGGGFGSGGGGGGFSGGGGSFGGGGASGNW